MFWQNQYCKLHGIYMHACVPFTNLMLRVNILKAKTMKNTVFLASLEKNSNWYTSMSPWSARSRPNIHHPKGSFKAK